MKRKFYDNLCVEQEGTLNELRAKISTENRFILDRLERVLRDKDIFFAVWLAQFEGKPVHEAQFAKLVKIVDQRLTAEGNTKQQKYS